MKRRRTKIINTVAELHTHHGLMTAFAVGLGGSQVMADHYENCGQRELENSRELPTNININNGSDYVTIYAKMGIRVLRKKPDDDMFCEAILPQGWKVQRTDHSMWSNMLDDKGRVRAQIFYKASPWDRDAFLNQNKRFSIDFHKYLSEEEKFLPARIIMVDEEIPIDDNRRIDRMGINGNWMIMDDYGNMITSTRRIRKVQKEIIERRYPSIYEEMMATPYWVEVKDIDGTILFSTEKQYIKIPYPMLHKVGPHFLWSEEEKTAHREWWKQHTEFEELQHSIGKLWLDRHYPNWNDCNAYWDTEIIK